MSIIKLLQSDREFNTPVFQAVRESNESLRMQFVDNLRKVKSVYEKIEILKAFFVSEFFYDYGRVFLKQPETRTFRLGEHVYESLGFTNTNFETSPTTYLVKLAQCTTFADEVSLIMCANGVYTQKVKGVSHCFNKFSKSLEQVGHQHNLITLPCGKTEPLDITAIIMERDAKQMNLDLNYKLLRK